MVLSSHSASYSQAVEKHIRSDQVRLADHIGRESDVILALEGTTIIGHPPDDGSKADNTQLGLRLN